jgi:hypothetical protein
MAQTAVGEHERQIDDKSSKRNHGLQRSQGRRPRPNQAFLPEYGDSVQKQIMSRLRHQGRLLCHVVTVSQCT